MATKRNSGWRVQREVAPSVSYCDFTLAVRVLALQQRGPGARDGFRGAGYDMLMPTVVVTANSGRTPTQYTREPDENGAT